MERIAFYFVVGSVIGWLMEVFFKTISKESLDRAGMGKGPYCMAYGIGMVLLLTIVAENFNNIVVIFLLSSFVGTVFEYITAMVLKKIYGLVLWEYTKLKFAINDHICLEFMVLWGVLGVIFSRYMVPYMNKIYDTYISYNIINILYIISVCIILDYLITGFFVIKSNKKEQNKSL